MAFNPRFIVSPATGEEVLRFLLQQPDMEVLVTVSFVEVYSEHKHSRVVLLECLPIA